VARKEKKRGKKKIKRKGRERSGKAGERTGWIGKGAVLFLPPILETLESKKRREKEGKNSGKRLSGRGEKKTRDFGRGGKCVAGSRFLSGGTNRSFWRENLGEDSVKRGKSGEGEEEDALKCVKETTNPSFTYS